jgi:hypothetical protein
MPSSLLLGRCMFANVPDDGDGEEKAVDTCSEDGGDLEGGVGQDAHYSDDGINEYQLSCDIIPSAGVLLEQPWLKVDKEKTQKSPDVENIAIVPAKREGYKIGKTAADICSGGGDDREQMIGVGWGNIFLVM